MYNSSLIAIIMSLIEQSTEKHCLLQQATMRTS